MFIAVLTYIRPLEEIDALIPAHSAFLDEHYGSGLFVASGRRVPRTGGIILISGDDQALAEAVLNTDPFHSAGAATFELFQFTLSRAQGGFPGFN